MSDENTTTQPGAVIHVPKPPKVCWPGFHRWFVKQKLIVRNEPAEKLVNRLVYVPGNDAGIGLLRDLNEDARPRVHSTLICADCGCEKVVVQ